MFFKRDNFERSPSRLRIFTRNATSGHDSRFVGTRERENRRVRALTSDKYCRTEESRGNARIRRGHNEASNGITWKLCFR